MEHKIKGVQYFNALYFASRLQMAAVVGLQQLNQPAYTLEA